MAEDAMKTFDNTHGRWTTTHGISSINNCHLAEKDNGENESNDYGMMKGKARGKWHAVFHEFAQNTTMHGMSRIEEETPFKMRRWVIG